MSKLLEQIAGTASEMRANQRSYFRTRDPEALRHSRVLETKLDQLTDEWRAIQKGVRQTSLFQEEAAGEIPRRFQDWSQDDHHDVLWWETSMTGGAITEPPSYIGGPSSSDWPFEIEDEPHLLWVPLPKLARGTP